ncbi:hemerythrin domain-containing protein [Paucibacter soli]|uniref:hemerythrin domain-containing protein n=1 Tax=Paucibacter soli TaxID=3133433 RepID=UPI003096163C
MTPQHTDRSAHALTRQADAFGPVALTTFAANPAGSHLFRVQHEQLTALMTSILAATEVDVTGDAGVLARNKLTSLATLLPLHQSMEEGLVHRALSAEPRLRMTAETFEREMSPLVAELAALSRRFPSASSIINSPRGEFAQACSSLFTRLQERFRREERDIFSAFDRVVGVGAVSVAVAA